MERTRLSTKGQIILPKAIREARAWGPGTEFTVEEAKGVIVLRPAKPLPAATLDEVAGCLRSNKKLRTEGQIKEAVEQQIRRRHAGGRY